MEVRLAKAKEILTDDGVIFISIDDKEQAYLKILCDKIFGEDNFINTIIWKKGGGKSDSNFLANKKEYCHVYQKGKLKGFTKQESPLTNYKFRDDKGLYALRSFCMGGLSYAPTLDYVIQAPDGSSIYAGWDEEKYKERQSGKVRVKDWCWTLSKKEYDKRLAENRIVFKKHKGVWKVYYKSYYEGKTYPYSDIYEDVGNTASSQEIKDIFGYNAFNYSKPKDFIKFIISLYPSKDIKVLDFFAGSGTTGLAVLELNKEDFGDRTFVLCTNNEISIEKEKSYLISNNLIIGKNKKELNLSYKEYIKTEEYKELQKEESYLELGICRSITYKRLESVIKGYKSYKNNNFVEGIQSNLKYLRVKVK